MSEDAPVQRLLFPLEGPEPRSSLTGAERCAGAVLGAAIGDAMNLMNRAMGVLSGVAAAGKSVATDLVKGGDNP